MVDCFGVFLFVFGCFFLMVEECKPIEVGGWGTGRGGPGRIESYVLSVDREVRQSYTGFSSFVDNPEADPTSL